MESGTTSDWYNSTEDWGSYNTTEQVLNDPEPDHSPEATVVPIVFAIVFIAGVVGNCALIFTVLKNKQMRNTPNIFVVNLSIGDLLLLLCSVPFSSTLYTFTSWPFGQFLCKFNEYMQTLSLGVSVFTLTALSGDRYIAIVYPMSKHTGKPTLITIVTVIGIWGLAGVLAFPDGYTSAVVSLKTGEDNSTNVTKELVSEFCFLYSQNLPHWYAKGHTIFRFVIFFLMPLLIIAMFYAMMARILVTSSRQMPCEIMKNSMSNMQQRRQIKARLKVAKVVLSFVLIFILCWLPRHIYLLSYHISPDFQFSWFWHVFKIVAFCLTYIYSCVNPYALYFLSSQFRKYYNRYLFCCCPKFSYRTIGQEQSTLYNFNTTVRRGSTTVTAFPQSQSMC